MTKKQVIEKLNEEVLAAGGQRAFARKHGMSAPYINDVLHGNRSPGPKILKALGISSETTYNIVYKRV